MFLKRMKVYKKYSRKYAFENWISIEQKCLQNLQTYSIKWITLHQALSLLKCNTLWLMKMWVNRKNWTKSTGLNCAHRISQVVKLKIQFWGDFPFYSMKFLQVHFNNDFSFFIEIKEKNPFAKETLTHYYVCVF